MTETNSSQNTIAQTILDPFEELTKVVQELSQARSIEQITRIVRHASRSLTGSDGATFVLRDGDRCHYVDEDAITPLWKGQKFPMSACISGWVMLNRIPAVIEDIYQDERIPIDAYRPTFVKSLVMVPIRSIAPIGAIGNYWANHHQAGECELRILQALADSTSVAIENVQIYERLRQSEHRYRELMERLEDIVFSLDKECRIRYISPAVSKLGYKSDEILTLPLIRFIHQADRDAMQSNFDQALKGTAVSCEFRGISKDEKIFIFRTTLCPHWSQNSPEGLNGVLVDLTRQRQAEEQLRSAQRLEAIGRLAGGIAHDFNNLLTLICSYADFVLEKVKTDEEIAEEIRQIQSAGSRAASLTRQLLAFGRKQVMKPTVVNLNRVIKNIEKMLSRLLKEDIIFSSLLGENLGSTMVDKSQIEQVVMNLVINARDAMPEGGRLNLETANVFLDENYQAQHSEVRPGPYIQLVISDTGSGMDRETIERIFEPFFTTKSYGQGTGLGLATVYGIVRQSGGHIWVYSEPGLGTTFKVYFPRCENVPENAPEPELKAVHSSAGETILVVEDLAELRSLIERMLKKAGYKVLLAADGEEALQVCEAHSGGIALAITDVIMPKLSGREFVEKLALVRPQTSVIFMSGYTDDTIVHQGILDPGTNFLAKPFNAAELTAKINEVLGRKKKDSVTD